MLNRILDRRFLCIAAGTPLVVIIAMAVGEQALLLRLKAQASSRPPTPLTVRFNERIGTGDKTFEKQLVISIRSDGSESELRRGWSPVSGTIEERYTVRDMSARVRVAVDTPTASKTTYPLEEGHMRAILAKRNDCSPPQNAPSKQILGTTAYQVVRALPDPGNTIREAWVAPDAGCLALVERFTQQSNGQSVVMTERIATELTWGEPASTYFAIPAGYVEREPSAVMIERSRRYPGAPAGKLQVQDDAYRSANKK
ncbi:hypothetical protein F183_A49850 [Bryobacterales bacterium F-183]|nr:hypothetical protein F183_A49850 [Bryobacterales bacterium F-183]